MVTPRRRTTRHILLTLALIAVSALHIPPARANQGGITLRSGKQQGATCTECHSGGVEPTVQFIGPRALGPGETATFRFEVRSNNPAQRAAGFNVAASGGMLDVLPDQGARRAGDELTHNLPKSNVDIIAGWDFTWTAPDAPGLYTLFGAGNSVNLNSQFTGDRSSTTTLDISVAASTETPTATPTPTVTPTMPTPTITPTFAPVPCVGDCDDNGDIAITELITGVSIALGNATIDVCPEFDANGSRRVEINELIIAVSGALRGCVQNG
jgi:hypothetical protein